MPQIQDILQNNVNRIAENQYAIRPLLVNRLKEQVIFPEGKGLVGNYDNFYQVWQANLHDRFYDMGNFIRLGSVIEGNLKTYYMHKKGYSNNVALMGDSRYEENIFQRVQPWTKKNVLSLYKDELGFDLNSIPQLPKIQELIINRHLYAHSSGVLNDKYIDHLKRITGIDMLTNPEVIAHYPIEDIYWFEPLNHLGEFIESARSFFSKFPN